MSPRTRPDLDSRFVWRVVASLAAGAFISEFIVMFVLESLPHHSRLVESLIDATTLSAVLSIVVVLVVVRPLRRHILQQVDELNGLIRHQEWLGLVFDSVDESIVVTDANGVIEHVNPAFTRRMGWQLEEVLGRKTSILSSGSHPPAQYHEMWERLKKTGAWQGRVVDKTRTGELLELLMVISPLRSADGSVRGYVAIHRDLGDVVEHEQNLQRALDRMGAAKTQVEEASAAKSRFLSTMSHEIRTPLSGILGTLELLDRAPLPPKQREYTDLALRSARALLALLNDVLDFSKLDAQGVTLVSEPFDVSLVAREVRELFLAQAQHRQLALEVVGADAPVWVQGDQVRMRQVLSNLVGNAVKFTTAGHVTLRFKAKEDGTMTRLHVSVEDTGIGIPFDQRSQLFTPFHQVDATARRRFGGTGLGLAISKHLVEAMGGTLSVESVEGQGSTFTVQLALPRASRVASTGAIELTPSERDEVRGLKVLVAEDNAINQLVLSRILQRLGCVVTLVGDGRAALEQARELRFDAVLMDVQMPIMDGLEATRQIRGLASPYAAVPIVALTANAFAEDRERCLAAGMTDFLAKPVQESQLVRALVSIRRAGAPAEARTGT